MTAQNFPSLPAGEDLSALSEATGIPLPRLKKLWQGRRATYFDALLIERATSGRITPDHFRGNARRFSKKQGTELHGELVWGSTLGRKLGFHIIETGLKPKEWCLHHRIRPTTVYAVLMVGHIPRADHANRLIAATQAGGAPGITHADLYEHHAEHRARSAKAAA